MICLDVTSSCKSAKNTGMQRTTRALYLHLRNRLAVTPICWNRTCMCYHNSLKSLASFTQVICISHESRDDLLRRWHEYGSSPTTTRVEPWPIEFDRAVCAADSVRARNMIACVGSFEPRKNHLTFLAAAEKLWLQGHDFELQLVGRTTGYYAPKILPAVWRLWLSGGGPSRRPRAGDEKTPQGYTWVWRSAYSPPPGGVAR